MDSIRARKVNYKLIECMGIGKTFERGMTITICSFQGTN